jgi:hypothetical protein
VKGFALYKAIASFWLKASHVIATQEGIRVIVASHNGMQQTLIQGNDILVTLKSSWFLTFLHSFCTHGALVRFAFMVMCMQFVLRFALTWRKSLTCKFARQNRFYA